MKRGFSHVPDRVVLPRTEKILEYPKHDFGSGLPYIAKDIGITKFLEVYTDGACNKETLAGGWGFYIPSCVFLRHGTGTWLDSLPIKQANGKLPTTNNEMELTAVANALGFIAVRTGKNPDYEGVVVYSDSRYVISAVTMWYKRWQKNGWRTSEGTPVLNAELIRNIRALIELLERGSIRVEFKWVKGHAGILGNEIADGLASEQADVFSEL